MANLVYAAIGYTLGARAGRDRYEDIVRIARRVGGSQTVQATVGVLEGQLDHYVAQIRTLLDARPAGRPRTDQQRTDQQR